MDNIGTKLKNKMFEKYTTSQHILIDGRNTGKHYETITEKNVSNVKNDCENLKNVRIDIKGYDSNVHTIMMNTGVYNDAICIFIVENNRIEIVETKNYLKDYKVIKSDLFTDQRKDRLTSYEYFYYYVNGEKWVPIKNLSIKHELLKRVILDSEIIGITINI